jgi:hypothetical protein
LPELPLLPELKIAGDAGLFLSFYTGHWPLFAHDDARQADEEVD